MSAGVRPSAKPAARAALGSQDTRSLQRHGKLGDHTFRNYHLFADLRAAGRSIFRGKIQERSDRIIRF